MLASIFRRMVIVLSVLVLGIYLLLWLLSPWLIKSQSAPLLESLKFKLTESTQIRFNPFTFTLSLKDSGLESLDGSESYLNIDYGEINLNAFALADKVISFEEISLADANLTITRGQDSLVIVGFPVLGKEDQQEEEPAPEADSDLEWRIEVSKLLIEQLKGQINDHGIAHEAQLKQLRIQDVALGMREQEGELSLEANINDALVSSRIAFSLSRETGTVATRVEIENFNPDALVYLSDGAITRAEARVSLKVESEITLKQEGLRVQWQQLALQIEDLNTQADAAQLQSTELTLEIPAGQVAVDYGTQPGLEVRADELLLRISGIEARSQGLSLTLPEASLQMQNNHAALDKGKLAQLDSRATLQLSQLALANATNDSQILSTATLVTDPVEITLDDNAQPQASTTNITLTDLVLSQQAGADEALPALFKSGGIDLKGLHINAQAGHLDQLTLKPFQAAILVAPDKSVRNLVVPERTAANEQNAATAQTTPKEQDAQATDYAFSLGQFSLQGESELFIEDQSVQPVFRETFYLSKAETGALDSTNKQQTTPFSLAFKAGKYAQGNGQGDIALFSDKLNMNLEASIKEFPVPKISPYVRQAAGLDLLSGQFDNVINLTIRENEIEGLSELNLRGLEVESATDVKQGDLSEHSFIPLSLALGALKDSDGNIEMEVPLSGNVNDPDFGLKGFLYLVSQKAAMAAAESYVINTFVPYANIVSLTRMAGEYALKVRIEDLVYSEGQVALDDSQQDFIDGFVALLEQKPKLQVKVCPIATLGDLKDDSADMEQPDVISKLQAIAQQRGEQFKDLVVRKSGVASSRLLVCQEKIDGREDGRPRIEFSI